jgi:hypothetical protein
MADETTRKAYDDNVEETGEEAVATVSAAVDTEVSAPSEAIPSTPTVIASASAPIVATI